MGGTRAGNGEVGGICRRLRQVKYSVPSFKRDRVTAGQILDLLACAMQSRVEAVFGSRWTWVDGSGTSKPKGVETRPDGLFDFDSLLGTFRNHWARLATGTRNPELLSKLKAFRDDWAHPCAKTDSDLPISEIRAPGLELLEQIGDTSAQSQLEELVSSCGLRFLCVLCLRSSSASNGEFS